MFNLMIKTKIILSKRIHSLKYLRSTALGCDIEIGKSEFVTKTQFLSPFLDNIRSKTLKVSIFQWNLRKIIDYWLPETSNGSTAKHVSLSKLNRVLFAHCCAEKR